MLIKDPLITTDNNDLERRIIEGIINLRSRLLRVGSLPNYESAVGANKPDNIDPSQPKRLALDGFCSKTKIRIVKLAKVYAFDSLMCLGL